MNDNRDYVCIIPEKVMFDTSLTALDLRIYGLVSSFMYTTGKFYKSNETISEKLGADSRSIRRSIARLVEKLYLNRFVDPSDNKRYLSIRQNSIEEKLVSCQGEDSNVRGGGLKCPGREDTNVLQSVLSMKTKEQQQERPVVVDFNKLTKQAGVSLPAYGNLLRRYGEKLLHEKLQLLISQPAGVINNPDGWLTIALKEDYEVRLDKAVCNAPQAPTSAEAIVTYNRHTKFYSEAVKQLNEHGVVEPAYRIGGNDVEFYNDVLTYNDKLSKRILDLGGVTPVA